MNAALAEVVAPQIVIYNYMLIDYSIHLQAVLKLTLMDCMLVCKCNCSHEGVMCIYTNPAQ